MIQFDERQDEFARRIRELVDAEIAPLALEIESSSEFPRAAYEVFKREKLLALAMPQEYGGLQADATTLALMVENISRVSPSAVLTVFPSNAVLRVIAHTGSEAQKQRLLPKMAEGSTLMGFCLTEPEHGSDAAGLQTTARLSGDHYLVRGTKSFITLGPHADYYLTFVRTGEGRGAAGISALLIPRSAPGLNFGEPEKKMGLHGSVTTQMFLDDAVVDTDMRLWGPGEGWRVLTEVANPMRVWGAAAMALGVSQGLLDEAVAHANGATGADGRSLLGQQDVAFLCADMKMAVEACRSLVYRVCAMVDASPADGRGVDVWVSMAKCFAADTAVKVGDMASTVMGMAMATSDSLAGRLYHCAKGIQIFDGSNQVQRMVVSRKLAEEA